MSKRSGKSGPTAMYSWSMRFSLPSGRPSMIVSAAATSPVSSKKTTPRPIAHDYAENVDALAAAMAPDVLGKEPEDKPWGMYEFGVSDPDQTLVRVGCPSNRKHTG